VTLKTFKAAAVQAAPIFLDASATVEKACALARDAARAGAELIVFPEVFVAGYPYWNWYLSQSPAIYTPAGRLPHLLLQ
jgi:nitrilase